MASRASVSTPFAMLTKPLTRGAAWSMTVFRARDRCRNLSRSGSSFGSGGEKRVVGELVRVGSDTPVRHLRPCFSQRNEPAIFAILHHRNLLCRCLLQLERTTFRC